MRVTNFMMAYKHEVQLNQNSAPSGPGPDLALDHQAHQQAFR